jgi:hypothetical protein
MDKKEAKIYCLNKNCSLFEKDLSKEGIAGAAFIFCPKCTRKLFNEDNHAKKHDKHRKRTSQNNNNNRSKNKNINNNNNRNQNTHPSSNTITGSQTDPTVVMLLEKMLSIISSSAK